MQCTDEARLHGQQSGGQARAKQFTKKHQKKAGETRAKKFTKKHQEKAGKARANKLTQEERRKAALHGNIMKKLARRDDGLLTDPDSHAPSFWLTRYKYCPPALRARINKKKGKPTPESRAACLRERNRRSLLRWQFQRIDKHRQPFKLAGLTWNKAKKKWRSEDVVCGVCLCIKDREVAHTQNNHSVSELLAHLSFPFIRQMHVDLCGSDLYAMAVEKDSSSPLRTIHTKVDARLRKALRKLRPQRISEWAADRYLCDMCGSNIRTHKPNHISWNAIGVPLDVDNQVPAPLRALTLAERRIVGICSVAAELHLRRSWEQIGLEGCVVISPRETPLVQNLLKQGRHGLQTVLLDLLRDSGPPKVVHYRVHMGRLRDAITWLQQNNPLYEHFNIEAYMNDVHKEFEATNDDADTSDSALSDEDVGDGRVYHLHDAVGSFERRAIVHLTDRAGKSISSTNPFAQVNIDAKAFPACLPAGDCGIYTGDRVDVSAHNYIHARMTSAAAHFGTDPQYVSWALQVFEDEILDRNIFFGTRTREQITAEDVRSGLTVGFAKKLFWPVLLHLRGSDGYFINMRGEVEGMTRVLGPPSWFMTLGPKEKEWVDQYIALLRAEAFAEAPAISEEQLAARVNAALDHLDVAVAAEIGKLEREEGVPRNRPEPAKCIAKLSAKFVLASTRQFYRRVLKFRKWLKAHPDVLRGKVHDIVIRIEFQDRGFPHAHILIWTKGTPDVSTPAGAQEAMDAYIRQCVRTDRAVDDEVLNLLVDLQVHVHTFTCKHAWDDKCRFDYGRPASETTRLATPADHMHKARWYVDKRTEKDRFIVGWNEQLLRFWGGNHDLSFVGNAAAAAGYVTGYSTKGEAQNFNAKLNKICEGCIKDGKKKGKNVRGVLFDIGAKLQATRRVAHHEMLWRAAGMPLKLMSRSFVYVNPLPAAYRWRTIKAPLTQLAAAKGDQVLAGAQETSSESIGVRRYMQRPSEGFLEIPADDRDSEEVEGGAVFVNDRGVKTVRRPWNDVTLHEFLSWTQVAQKHAKRGHGSIPLPGGDVLVVNNKRFIVQIPRLNPARDFDAYCYAILKLYMPWREESDLTTLQDGTRASARAVLFAEQTTTTSRLRLDIRRLDFTTDVSELLEKLEIYGRHDTGPGFGIPQNSDADSVSADEDDDAPPGGAPLFTMTQGYTGVRWGRKQYNKRRRELNVEQGSILHLVEAHAIELERTRQDPTDPLYLFVSGEGGTGKSALLHCIVQSLGRVNDFSRTVVAAFTGSASFLVNGRTLHSVLGLPVSDKKEGPPKRLPRLYGPKKREMENFWRNKDYILIDEISMVSSDLLTMIDLRLRELRHTDKPFGGLSVIALGDLYQLPPVGQYPVYNRPTMSGGALHAWRAHFLIKELTHNFRAEDDPVWTSLLRRLRVGDKSHWPADSALLRSRLFPSGTIPADLPAFYATRKEVRAHTTMKLREAKKAGTKYDVHKARYLKVGQGEFTGDAKQHRHVDDEDCGGLPHRLYLAKGFPVMLRHNIDADDGLVNGATGDVTSHDLDEGWVGVKFRNPLVGASKRKRFREDVLPDGSLKIRLSYSEFEGKFGQTVAAVQFPLVNAWAMTIHKAQGRTELRIRLCLGKTMRRDGLAYVGLSRCKSSGGVYLEEFDEGAFQCSRSAPTEMVRLRALTAARTKAKSMKWSPALWHAWNAVQAARARETGGTIRAQHSQQHRTQKRTRRNVLRLRAMLRTSLRKKIRAHRRVSTRKCTPPTPPPKRPSPRKPDRKRPFGTSRQPRNVRRIKPPHKSILTRMTLRSFLRSVTREGEENDAETYVSQIPLFLCACALVLLGGKRVAKRRSQSAPPSGDPVCSCEGCTHCTGSCTAEREQTYGECARCRSAKQESSALHDGLKAAAQRCSNLGEQLCAATGLTRTQLHLLEAELHKLEGDVDGFVVAPTHNPRVRQLKRDVSARIGGLLADLAAALRVGKCTCKNCSFCEGHCDMLRVDLRSPHCNGCTTARKKGAGEKVNAEYVALAERNLWWAANSCYMQAGLRLLFLIPDFTAFWLTKYTEWGSFRDRRARIFRGTFESDTQECASEFVRQMYDRWCTYRGWRTQTHWAAAPPCGLRLMSTLSCPCGAPPRETDDGWHAGLNVTLPRTPTTIPAVIAEFFTSTPVEYKCSLCKRTRTHTKTTAISEVSDYVFINLNRFEFDGTENTKLHTPVPPAHEIVLNGAKFGLRGIAEHDGASANGGHYVAYVKLRATGRWWLCDGEPGKTEESYHGGISDIAVRNAEAYVLLYKRLAT